MDVTEFWSEAPPEPSAGLKKWLGRIETGWKPNKRIRSMGYHESSEFFRIYIWEYLNVLRPILAKQESKEA